MAAPTVTLNNGVKMPIVGLGTFDVRNFSFTSIICMEYIIFQIATDPASLNAALKNGYRHIDTAWIYQNEKSIGNVLKEWFDSGKLKREHVFITTKLPTPAICPEKVENYLKQSLANLQLDYVDLYLIHFPIGINVNGEGHKRVLRANEKAELQPHTDHEGVWRKMEEQVKAGRTRSIGLSNYSVKQIERVLKVAEIKPACLQVENHVYLQQKELVDFAQKNGIVVVAYCPLASPGRAKFLERVGVVETKPLPDILSNKVIAQIGKKHNKSVAQVALRFLIERNIVVIPKSVEENRVRENIDLFDFKLDSEDMEALKNLDVGEDGRICDFRIVSNEIHLHPDYPFPV